MYTSELPQPYLGGVESPNPTPTSSVAACNLLLTPNNNMRLSEIV